jgi:hypothetical protein
MSVSNGQIANATTFNNAFASKTNDNTLTGKQTLSNTAPVSGASVANLQREHNAVASVLGLSLNQVYNYLFTWASDAIGAANDTVKARIEAILAAVVALQSSVATLISDVATLQAAIPWRAGVVAIADATGSKAVTFSSAMADTTYAVDFSFGNVVDSEPIFLQGVVTAKSTTGFTVTFNAPTDSANYTLSYHARKAN